MVQLHPSIATSTKGKIGTTKRLVITYTDHCDCRKIYQSRNDLFKHEKALHYENSGILHCQGPNCHFTGQRLIQLCEHLTSVHRIEIKLKTMIFASPNMALPLLLQRLSFILTLNSENVAKRYRMVLINTEFYTNHNDNMNSSPTPAQEASPPTTPFRKSQVTSKSLYSDNKTS